MRSSGGGGEGGWIIIGKGDTRLSNCVHGGLRLDLLPAGISLLRDVYYSVAVRKSCLGAIEANESGN